MTHLTWTLRHLKLGVAAALSVGLLAGCWGGDNDDDTASRSIPGSAFESSATFISYLRGLATNDTDEPLTLDGLTAPADDTGEPTPLT